MNSPHLTGLGEPEASGKQALFQPPTPDVEENNIPGTASSTRAKKKAPKSKLSSTRKIRRVRITTELTVDALQAIQAIQQGYRLKHGKVLPQWKVFSTAIMFYAKARRRGKPT